VLIATSSAVLVTPARLVLKLMTRQLSWFSNCIARVVLHLRCYTDVNRRSRDQHILTVLHKNQRWRQSVSQKAAAMSYCIPWTRTDRQTDRDRETDRHGYFSWCYEL